MLLRNRNELKDVPGQISRHRIGQKRKGKKEQEQQKNPTTIKPLNYKEKRLCKLPFVKILNVNIQKMFVKKITSQIPWRKILNARYYKERQRQECDSFDIYVLLYALCVIMKDKKLK